MRLSGDYGAARTEVACRKALAMHVATYTGVKAVLKNNLDQVRAPAAPCQAPVVHDNIRGAGYYIAENDPADPSVT